MNKEQFISILKEGLKDFPPQELQDIIYDYEEHFYSAMEAGKSEEDIINELGDPYVIVNGYRSGYLQKKEEKKQSNNSQEYNEINSKNKSVDVNKILKIVIAILAIMLIGPLVFGLGVGAVAGIFGLVVGLISIPFSFSVAGIAILISSLFNHTLGFINVPNFIADFPIEVIVLGTVGSITLSLLMIIIGYYVVKIVIKSGIRLGRTLIKKYNEGGRI
ncbi:MAG: DUF1700 domain-containing protein [Clostridium sp.]